MDLQSLGYSRSLQCLLPGQSRRAHGGPAWFHLFHSDFHRAPVADHARARFPNSSATSTSTQDARKPARRSASCLKHNHHATTSSRTKRKGTPTAAWRCKHNAKDRHHGRFLLHWDLPFSPLGHWFPILVVIRLPIVSWCWKT